MNIKAFDSATLRSLMAGGFYRDEANNFYEVAKDGPWLGLADGTQTKDVVFSMETTDGSGLTQDTTYWQFTLARTCNPLRQSDAGWFDQHACLQVTRKDVVKSTWEVVV